MVVTQAGPTLSEPVSVNVNVHSLMTLCAFVDERHVDFQVLDEEQSGTISRVNFMKFCSLHPQLMAGENARQSI